MCKRQGDFPENHGFTCEASEFSPDCPYQRECKSYKSSKATWQPDKKYQAQYAHACGYYN